jgi:hypothetical protein
MQMLGDHAMRPRSLSPKNCTQLGASDRNFEFPFENFGKKRDLFAQCRNVEIAHDPIETATNPGIESGGKLRPLKGVNWQRREEVLRAGRGGRFWTVRACYFYRIEISVSELPGTGHLVEGERVQFTMIDCSPFNYWQPK